MSSLHRESTDSLILFPLHPGSLPLVLNRDVSPSGTYSVRIVASMCREATVEYTIMDTNSDGEYNMRTIGQACSYTMNSTWCSSSRGASIGCVHEEWVTSSD